MASIICSLSGYSRPLSELDYPNARAEVNPARYP